MTAKGPWWPEYQGHRDQTSTICADMFSVLSAPSRRPTRGSVTYLSIFVDPTSKRLQGKHTIWYDTIVTPITWLLCLTYAKVNNTLYIYYWYYIIFSIRGNSDNTTELAPLRKIHYINGLRSSDDPPRQYNTLCLSQVLSIVNPR